jgi:hypothetical protein
VPGPINSINVTPTSVLRLNRMKLDITMVIPKAISSQLGGSLKAVKGLIRNIMTW